MTAFLRLRPPGEEGFSTVEFVLLVPVFVLLLLLVVGAGRVEQARIQVTGAARDAARAASLTRTPAQAGEAARATAAAALGGQRVTCAGGPEVVVDSAAMAPGGYVEVTVTCRARLGDLGFPALPGAKALTATAASPVETYRAAP